MTHEKQNRYDYLLNCEAVCSTSWKLDARPQAERADISTSLLDAGASDHVPTPVGVKQWLWT